MCCEVFFKSIQSSTVNHVCTQSKERRTQGTPSLLGVVSARLRSSVGVVMGFPSVVLKIQWQGEGCFREQPSNAEFCFQEPRSKNPGPVSVIGSANYR